MLIGRNSSALIGSRRSMRSWRKEARMNDVELTRALERGEIANENFHHASHLHVAWVYLSESSSVDEAAAKMRETLRQFAASAGKLEKYHETITLFWVHLLSRAHATAGGESLEKIVHANPCLLERIFHSVIIRESGFSATTPGLLGWNLT